MNTKIKTKTYESALGVFKSKHGKANREYLVEIDRDGFVHNYRQGGKGSVTPRIDDRKNKGKMFVHNHPKEGWDNFSKADLVVTAGSTARGIVATSYNGKTFTIEKGTHFKKKEFTRAVEKAKIHGLNYNHAMDNWLTANQKRYGYKYTTDGYRNPSRKKRK